MVLTYDAYTETIEEKHHKDNEIQSLKKQMASISEAQKEFQQLLNNPKKLLAVLKKES